MPTVTCECGKRLKVGDQLVAKRVKCPGCGQVFTVGGSEPATGTGETTAKTAPEAGRPADRCSMCGAPMSAGAVVCTKCGYSKQLGTRVKKLERVDTKGGRPLFNLLGIDFTPLKTAVACVGLAVVVLAVVWYMRLSTDFKVLAARRVNVLTALEPIAVLRPADLSIGSFNPMGDAGAGVKLPPGTKAPSNLPMEVSTGDVYALGGTDKILLTGDNPSGTHLLLRAEVSQRLMEDEGMTARRDLMFRNDAFTIQGAGATAPGQVLKARLKSGVKIGLSNAKSSEYTNLLPPGFNPSSKQIKSGHFGGAASGWVNFNPTTGLKGRLDFTSFYYQSGAPGVRGLSAEGKLAMNDRNGFSVDYQYNGDTMNVNWKENVSGWHSAVRYDVRRDISPYKKYEITLLFHLPASADLAKLELHLGKKRLAKLKGRIDSPPVAGTATAQPRKKKGYFGLLADAKKRGVSAKAGIEMTQIDLAFKMYAEEHQDALPDTLDALRPYLGSFDQFITDPRTGRKDRFIYVKPAEKLGDIPNPDGTPIIHEARDGKPDPRGATLYVSGRVVMGR